jgi:hypothetical protein
MREAQDNPVRLEWCRGQGWELWGETGLRMTLTPRERGWFAQAGDAAWTLQRVGFHRPRVVIRPVGQLAEVAHLQSDWRGLYALHIASGPTWELDPTHSGGISVRDDRGANLLSVSWAGLDSTRAKVSGTTNVIDGRFGDLCLAASGHLLLEHAQDPTRRLAVGVPFGTSARRRLTES